MQVATGTTKLVSLLLVFLSENYKATFGTCEICGSSTPSFGKVFEIGVERVCVNCVIMRIEGKNA